MLALCPAHLILDALLPHSGRPMGAPSTADVTVGRQLKVPRQPWVPELQFHFPQLPAALRLAAVGTSSYDDVALRNKPAFARPAPSQLQARSTCLAMPFATQKSCYVVVDAMMPGAYAYRLPANMQHFVYLSFEARGCLWLMSCHLPNRQ